MRFDAVGLFWEDRPAKSKGDRTLGPMPEIPETGWRPPPEFPNLSAAKAIALDTETYDPELLTAGPGWARGRGEIVGVSLATPDGSSWYFPIRHQVQREYNLDPAKVLAWLAHTLGTGVPKIGANLIYDVGWLREEGVTVRGPLYDIQFAEALLDSEAPDVALENLAAKYLGTGKETSLLYQWCADYYGGPVGDRQRANIYRSPPRLAGPYAEADAALPIRILEKQWPLLEQRGVMHLFELECRLIRLLIDMRFKGAPVNLRRVQEMHDELEREIKELQAQIKHLAGMEVNINASDSMQKAFDAIGLSYGTTESGKASFAADVLERVDHPLAKLILEQRQREKIKNTFIKSYVLDNQVNGRIHGQFHPLRGDTNGTRSGRFSSSTPNLQNIPVRSEMGKKMRTMWEATGKQWRKYDYSQIEYRLLAHHAVGQGAEDIRRKYINNPDTDYHDETIDMLYRITGIKMDRRPAKTINFGLIYGMSRRELIHRIGDGGDALFDAYHRAVPFAKATADAAAAEAKQYGYITTLLGRRSDFELWGPAKFDMMAKSLPFDQALLRYGKIERSFTHKALNRKLQGGAADIMKAAMVRCYEDGLFDVVGIPLLTVHDELDFDDEGAPDEAWAEMARTMETCVNTRVPIRVDGSIGPNWGEAD